MHFTGHIFAVIDVYKDKCILALVIERRNGALLITK